MYKGERKVGGLGSERLGNKNLERLETVAAVTDRGWGKDVMFGRNRKAQSKFAENLTRHLISVQGKLELQRERPPGGKEGA